MADVKISALPAATTPLDGTELAPIVQSGTTKRVTVANLTVGRALTASSLTLTTPLSAGNGGTGQNGYTTGDLLYASDAATLSKLADVATGNALISGGVGTAPSWGKIGLTTHVSGTLPVARGGTGLTSLNAGYIPYGNGTGAFGSSSNLFWDDTNNRLGIGTNAPSYILDLYAANDSTARLRLINTTGYNVFWSSNSGGGTWVGTESSTGGVLMSGTPAYASVITSTATTPLCFGVGTTERMRLDTAGNLGLGVTPSAWDAGFQVLENSGGSYSSGSNGAIRLMQNAYYGSSAYRYKFSSTNASRYEMNGGSHTWYNATASLTAGGTVNGTGSWTQAMTLDASGRLGVGIASPSYIVQAAAAVSGYWNNSSAWVGTPAALSISNTLNGGYDAAIIFQQTDSGGTTKLSGGIGLVGTSGWTAGNNSTQISDMYFAVKNSSGGISERVRITSSGELLVGTTTTSASSGQGVKILPGGLVYAVAPTSSGDNYNYYNTTASAYRFYVSSAGTINATSTTITAISDRRLKENIVDLDVGLDALLTLKPRKFDWKAGKGKDIKGDRGWIADEFQQVFPDLIDTWKDTPPEGEEPYKSVRPDLMPVIVKAIQELAAKVSALEAKQ